MWLILFVNHPGNTFKAHGKLHVSYSSNDHIFPSAKNAKLFIDFDSKGFSIRGKRIFLVSAGIEYARVPHQLWHDRLLRLRRAGFNCVEIYTFWNFHEPQEGRFLFSGDQDLGLFLKEVQAAGTLQQFLFGRNLWQAGIPGR